MALREDFQVWIVLVKDALSHPFNFDLVELACYFGPRDEVIAQLVHHFSILLDRVGEDTRLFLLRIVI